jgi:hypothetical protein
MMREVLTDIHVTARGLLRAPRAVLVLLATYVAFLATTALFITTREATIAQVSVTFLTLIAAPALFFLLQAMCVSYAEATTTVGDILKKSCASFWKVMLAALPVIVVAIVLHLLIARVELASGSDAPTSLRVLFATLRILVFGIMAPLVCIHFWLALGRGKAGSERERLGQLLRRAFAPRSLTTYGVGLVLFGIVPYLLLVAQVPVGSAWIEMTALGTRVALALSFVLFGWVITVGALRKGMSDEELHS